ncbi:PepSY domain-containing protein [Actinosynnema sp. NPDC020468]|uniref:PepSY domain-containing protein n=1 Tax=Actinosynnema sp. NPDC020468 TaxID=3154488 RepID=UPI0033CF36C5
MNSTTRRLRRGSIVAASVAGAFLAGGLAVGLISTASAQTDTSTPSTSSSTPRGSGDQDKGQGNADQSQPQRSDEKLLTGTDADKAKAAALAKYPGATVQRVETDSDGVYEAHLTTADGKRVTVEMDANFAVTGEEQGGPR